jgi:hypothetical protein
MIDILRQIIELNYFLRNVCLFGVMDSTIADLGQGYFG